MAYELTYEYDDPGNIKERLKLYADLVKKREEESIDEANKEKQEV